MPVDLTSPWIPLGIIMLLGIFMVRQFIQERRDARVLAVAEASAPATAPVEAEPAPVIVAPTPAAVESKPAEKKEKKAPLADGMDMAAVPDRLLRTGLSELHQANGRQRRLDLPSAS